MKTAFLALFLSTTAFADTCFTRTAELQTNQVSIARDYCFEKTSIELVSRMQNVGSVMVTMTKDGITQSFKTIATRSSVRQDEWYFGIDRKFVGGNCDSSWEVVSTGTFKLVGETPVIFNVDAELRYTNDNCHSAPRAVQQISFEKI